MKLWKNKLVTILFALGGALFLISEAIHVVKGEALNVTFLVLAAVFLVFALVFLGIGAVVGRSSGGGSGPHAIRPTHPVAGEEPAAK